jgi:hypothetical protein
MEDRSINWENVLVLIFFSSVILINTISLLYSIIIKYILKKILDRKLIIKSLKIGLGITIGVITVLILNFLHILDIYYGLGVLFIGIIIFLVI